MGNDHELGSIFVSPIILLPKTEYVKLVVNATYIISSTSLTKYSWALEPVQMIMTCNNGKNFTASDLSCANLNVPSSPETQKLTSFGIGGRQNNYQVMFYRPCGPPQRLSRIIAIIFETLLKKKIAITFLDDSLLQSETKTEMFTINH